MKIKISETSYRISKLVAELDAIAVSHCLEIKKLTQELSFNPSPYPKNADDSLGSLKIAYLQHADKLQRLNDLLVELVPIKKLIDNFRYDHPIMQYVSNEYHSERYITELCFSLNKRMENSAVYEIMYNLVDCIRRNHSNSVDIENLFERLQRYAKEK